MNRSSGSSVPSQLGVKVAPGSRVVTRSPAAFVSSRTTRASPSSPCLAAPYAAPPGYALIDATEAM